MMLRQKTLNAYIVGAPNSVAPIKRHFHTYLPALPASNRGIATQQHLQALTRTPGQSLPFVCIPQLTAAPDKLEEMGNVSSDMAEKATKPPKNGEAAKYKPDDVKEVADILLEAVEEVCTSSSEDELIDREETEPTQKTSVSNPTEKAKKKAAIGDKRRKCPVPGCDVQRSRLTHINKHLKDDHGVPLEKGQAGNLEALRERQDEQFRLWCEEQGLPGDIPRDQRV